MKKHNYRVEYFAIAGKFTHSGCKTFNLETDNEAAIHIKARRVALADFKVHHPMVTDTPAIPNYTVTKIN